MNKYLRIYFDKVSHDKASAIEYLTDTYIDYKINIEKTRLVWKSNEVDKIEQLVDMLQDRGWHLTDIYDAMDEARASSDENKDVAD